MGDREKRVTEVVVDVREDLRNGREPFQKIMSAAGTVPIGSTLVLYATFKPTPLIAVLRGQGFEGEAEKIEGGDWKVVFRRTSAEHDGGVAAGEGNGSGTEIELDNRGLEPPEPMVRTLEAINRLGPGGRIVGHFDRRPMFLLPKLDDMGFSYVVTQKEDGSATLVISRPDNAN